MKTSLRKWLTFRLLQLVFKIPQSNVVELSTSWTEQFRGKGNSLLGARVLHKTLNLYKESQRNIRSYMTHVESHCFVNKRFIFAVAVRWFRKDPNGLNITRNHVEIEVRKCRRFSRYPHLDQWFKKTSSFRTGLGNFTKQRLRIVDTSHRIETCCSI